MENQLYFHQQPNALLVPQASIVLEVKQQPMELALQDMFAQLDLHQPHLQEFIHLQLQILLELVQLVIIVSKDLTIPLHVDMEHIKI